MQTPKEQNVPNEKIESMSEVFTELTSEELEQITGGRGRPLDSAEQFN